MTVPARGWLLLVTCEHGGCVVPASCRRAFAGWATRLRSHRGYDRGSRTLALRFSRRFGAPRVVATVSRLVVDLNRSEGHPRLFSSVTGALPPAARARLLARHYHPHRRQVEAAVAAIIDRGECVLHVAVHTFTPVLRGQRRRADVGLLYDPGRSAEVALAHAWCDALRADGRAGVVRLNYPYRGTADGLPTAMRRRFSASRYAGIELEVNQRHVRDNRVAPALATALTDTLALLLR